MKMSKVGNQTNSQDPQAVNSRVFVGNLNTFQCSKTDVERMFQRYGRLAGISMHKGYAFVQFTNPFDARSACLGEDGRTVLGQTLDVNMVAEPKPHQTGRKRQNMAKTGNDWDYYYDSYYASAQFLAPRLVPPLKRPRLMGAASTRPAGKSVTTHKQTSPPPNPSSQSQFSLGQLKIYSNPDILICGNCREMFTDLQELWEHKKAYCKLRFTCKCNNVSGSFSKSPRHDTASLLCVQCKDSFVCAWDLMEHVQSAHMLNIYELGVNIKNTDCLSPPLQSTPPESPINKEDDIREDLINREDLIQSQDLMNRDDLIQSQDLMNREDLMQSPEVMDEVFLGSTPQSCIMHALRIEHTDFNDENGAILKPLTNGELKAQD